MATLAGVLRRFGAAYLAEHVLSTPQAKAWRAIVACRTADLGGHRLQCDACGHAQAVYHSCRNRHCPQCGARAKERWLQARLAEVLPVPYAHVVFTLPHVLNPLYGAHPQWVIHTLFAATAQTLTEFAANARWLGGIPAFSLLLHTWTQDLRRHLHVHALIACGALAADGHWQVPQRSPRFLFPVAALSRVFRGKFLAALQEARKRALLPRDPQAAPGPWQQRHQALYQHPWVVYAKTPVGGPAQVLDYLARYTHRTALSNERIVGMTDTHVSLRVRADAHGGKQIVHLPGPEFVRRFLLHVLPTGIKRVRHYGVLAPAGKRMHLAQARAALQMPVPNPRASESAAAFLQRVAHYDVLQCPCCASGRLRVIAGDCDHRCEPLVAAAERHLERNATANAGIVRTATLSWPALVPGSERLPMLMCQPGHAAFVVASCMTTGCCCPPPRPDRQAGYFFHCAHCSNIGTHVVSDPHPCARGLDHSATVDRRTDPTVQSP